MSVLVLSYFPCLSYAGLYCDFWGLVLLACRCLCSRISHVSHMRGCIATSGVWYFWHVGACALVFPMSLICGVVLRLLGSGTFGMSVLVLSYFPCLSYAGLYCDF